ncbi:MAG: DUF5615 family PIN-like protein [Pseudomonadota bacterium]
MKLLFDENISAKLVKLLADQFPDSSHIDLLNMQGESDTIVWDYAKCNNYIIMSKDNDFRQRAFVTGPPPKVIWLNVGNGSTKDINQLIRKTINQINSFEKEPNSSLLVLSINT